jgi:hypothetical protein
MHARIQLAVLTAWAPCLLHCCARLQGVLCAVDRVVTVLVISLAYRSTATQHNCRAGLLLFCAELLVYACLDSPRITIVSRYSQHSSSMPTCTTTPPFMIPNLAANVLPVRYIHEPANKGSCMYCNVVPKGICSRIFRHEASVTHRCHYDHSCMTAKTQCMLSI